MSSFLSADICFGIPARKQDPSEECALLTLDFQRAAETYFREQNPLTNVRKDESFVEYVSHSALIHSNNETILTCVGVNVYSLERLLGVYYKRECYNKIFVARCMLSRPRNELKPDSSFIILV